MQHSFSVSSFAHRNNRDGSTDSICPRCFATIGTFTWEADLDRIEDAHCCETDQRNRQREQDERLNVSIDDEERWLNQAIERAARALTDGSVRVCSKADHSSAG